MIISLTLLLILLLNFIPTSSAGFMDEWYECEPIIDIVYNDEDVNDPIMPYSEPKVFPIKVKIKIKGPLQHIVSDPKRYGSNEFFIDLYMEECPEWCKATIFPPLIKMNVSQNFQSADVDVAITLDKDAPAFEKSELKIRVVSRPMGNKAYVVPEGNKTLTIPFYVGYVPFLAINEIEGNHKVIGPNEMANFPLEIINLGNDATDIKTDFLTVPEGWNVEVIELLTLDQYLGKSYKKTLNLAIKPPDSFGYHEDREVIEISITPSSNKDSNMTGESYILSFVVHSRGFSTPGFEGILVILSIIIVLFIFRFKNLSKNNSKGGKSK